MGKKSITFYVALSILLIIVVYFGFIFSKFMNDIASIDKNEEIRSITTPLEPQANEIFEKTGLINKVYMVRGGNYPNASMIWTGKVFVPTTSYTYQEDEYCILLEGTEFSMDKDIWEQMHEGDVINVRFNGNLHIISADVEEAGESTGRETSLR